MTVADLNPEDVDLTLDNDHPAKNALAVVEFMRARCVAARIPAGEAAEMLMLSAAMIVSGSAIVQAANGHASLDLDTIVLDFHGMASTAMDRALDIIPAPGDTGGEGGLQ